MEMETFNLMALNDTGSLTRFNKLYSSSTLERQNAINTLLTNKNVLDVDAIELLGVDGDSDNIQSIINEYFKTIGLKLE